MILTTLLLPQLLIASSICQQGLKLVITNTTLTYPGLYFQALYDSNDKIYLIGGYNYTRNYTTYPIMQYTISNGNLETIGQFNKNRGCAVLTRNGDIYYVGGRRVLNEEMSAEIVKLRGADNFNNISVVNEFPTNLQQECIVMDPAENIYSYGGYDSQIEDTIVKYSIGTNTIQEVGRLPSTRDATSSVLNPVTSIAYIFGGYTGAYLDEILEYDLNTGMLSTLEVKLPAPRSNTCSVWDGNNAYIIGGLGYVQKFSITRFNPLTKNVTEFNFKNYPGSTLFSVGCTFVKELNRIYIFGGSGNSGLTRDIMYVELRDTHSPIATTDMVTTSTISAEVTLSEETTPREETTEGTTETPSDPFDCGDKDDFSTIPDPYCCNTYYLCKNGEAFQHNCDYKLQYSPTLNNCLPEDTVQCGLTYGISG